MSDELYVAIRRSPEDNRWSHMHFGKAPLPVIDNLMLLSGTEAVNPGDIITVISVDDISSIDSKTWNLWIVNEDRGIVVVRDSPPTKRGKIITWFEFWENTKNELYEKMMFVGKFPRLRVSMTSVLYEISKITKRDTWTNQSKSDDKQAISIIDDYIAGNPAKNTNAWYITSVIDEVKDDWSPYDYVIKYAFSTEHPTARMDVVNRFCATMTGHPNSEDKNAILTEVIPLYNLLLEVSR